MINMYCFVHELDKIKCLLVEQFPKDCQDVLWEGNTDSKVYQIYPQGSGELDVFCDQHTDGGGWTVLLSYFLLIEAPFALLIGVDFKEYFCPLLYINVKMKHCVLNFRDNQCIFNVIAQRS